MEPSTYRKTPCGPWPYHEAFSNHSRDSWTNLCVTLPWKVTAKRALTVNIDYACVSVSLRVREVPWWKCWHPITLICHSNMHTILKQKGLMGWAFGQDAKGACNGKVWHYLVKSLLKKITIPNTARRTKRDDKWQLCASLSGIVKISGTVDSGHSKVRHYASPVYFVGNQLSQSTSQTIDCEITDGPTTQGTHFNRTGHTCDSQQRAEISSSNGHLWTHPWCLPLCC